VWVVPVMFAKSVRGVGVRTGEPQGSAGGESCAAALIAEAISRSRSPRQAGSGGRCARRGVVRSGTLALVMTLVALVGAASASAVRGPTLPGELLGPDTVRPGTRYKWHGNDLAPAEAMHVSVQPRYCYGEPDCISRVPGSWTTGAVEGRIRFAFVFPSHYRVDCELQGCDPTPAFHSGEEVVVRACVSGPTGGAHYGYRCLQKSVVIAQPTSSGT
jgi:hypothetical protein